MRKNYIYAITLVVLSMAIALGYHFYLNYRPIRYEYGTFVELQKECVEDKWEQPA